MYTSQQSVENKVGGIPGWQALLTAVGFRLDPPASGLPAAVFFPTSDPGERLQQCSTTIQSLLGKKGAMAGGSGDLLTTPTLQRAGRAARSENCQTGPWKAIALARRQFLTTTYKMWTRYKA